MHTHTHKPASVGTAVAGTAEPFSKQLVAVVDNTLH